MGLIPHGKKEYPCQKTGFQYSTERDKKNQKKGHRFRVVFNSPVTLTFVGVCLLAFGLNYITHDWTNQHVFSTYDSSWLSPMTYVRLGCYPFGHASIQHLTGNLTFILLLGPILEEKYGHGLFSAIIAVTVVTTGVLNNVFFPNTALLGASGVVFAFILLSSIVSVHDGEIPITMLLIGIIYIGGEVMNAVQGNDNVSQFAHIMGGLIGTGCGMAFGRNHRD